MLLLGALLVEKVEARAACYEAEDEADDKLGHVGLLVRRADVAGATPRLRDATLAATGGTKGCAGGFGGGGPGSTPYSTKWGASHRNTATKSAPTLAASGRGHGTNGASGEAGEGHGGRGRRAAPRNESPLRRRR